MLTRSEPGPRLTCAIRPEARGRYSFYKQQVAYLNPLNPSLSRKSYRPLLARRPDADRTGAQLDGSGELQLLAVEAQDLDLPFRCGLIQKCAVVTPDDAALVSAAVPRCYEQFVRKINDGERPAYYLHVY